MLLSMHIKFKITTPRNIQYSQYSVQTYKAFIKNPSTSFVRALTAYSAFEQIT